MSPKLRIGYGELSVRFLAADGLLTPRFTVPEHFSSPLLQLAAKESSIELVSCPSESRRDAELILDR